MTSPERLATPLVALQTVEKAKRTRFRVIAVAAIGELTGLVAYFMLADFSNRLHLLILIASLLVYGTIAMAILALGSHVSVCTQRVLRAIDIVNANGLEKDE